MKPVKTGIKRSPSRNGVSATETEEKISMLEVASDNTFFFIVSTLGAGIVSLGAPHLGAPCPLTQQATCRQKRGRRSLSKTPYRRLVYKIRRKNGPQKESVKQQSG